MGGFEVNAFCGTVVRVGLMVWGWRGREGYFRWGWGWMMFMIK